MIPEALISAVLTCSPVQIDNRIDQTKHTETMQDVDVMIKAKKRCGEFYKTSPCVTHFVIKLDDWGNRMYSITCGEKIKKQPIIKVIDLGDSNG